MISAIADDGTPSCTAFGLLLLAGTAAERRASVRAARSGSSGQCIESNALSRFSRSPRTVAASARSRTSLTSAGDRVGASVAGAGSGATRAGAVASGSIRAAPSYTARRRRRRSRSDLIAVCALVCRSSRSCHVFSACSIRFATSSISLSRKSAEALEPASTEPRGGRRQAVTL